MPRFAAQSHTFFLRDPKLLLAELPDVDAAAEAEAANLAKVPEWVNVLPAPDAEGKIFSRDGRVLNIDDLEKLAARSNKALKKQKGGGPVDKDHELYGGWFTAGGGPAVGWAEAFEARPSGLFAKVDWLPEAKELISARKYRYTSAVVFGEHEWDRDGEGYPSTLQIYPDLVEGFAITNIPALQVTSMFTARGGDALRDESVRVLLQKLGIPADALAADIRAAHKRLAARGVFSIGASSNEPAHNTEKPTTPPADDPPPPIKKDETEEGGGGGEGGEGDAPAPTPPVPATPPPPPVPAAPPVASGGEDPEVAELRKQIAELNKSAGASFVDSLLASAKISPAMKAPALELAGTPTGLAQLRALYANAPAIVPTGAPAPTTSNPPTQAAPHGVDPLAHQLAQQGMSATEIARRLTQRDKEKTSR